MTELLLLIRLLISILIITTIGMWGAYFILPSRNRLFKLYGIAAAVAFAVTYIGLVVITVLF